MIESITNKVIFTHICLIIFKTASNAHLHAMKIVSIKKEPGTIRKKNYERLSNTQLVQKTKLTKDNLLTISITRLLNETIR